MLLGVDVGGTFTDAVLIAPEGAAIYTAKVPTTPEDQSRGVMEAVRAVLAQASAEPSQVERFAHGMTVATNALLEGKGARTALIATEGFADIVELGRQARAHLYRLCAAAPAPLAPAELRFEAPERMTADGPSASARPTRGRSAGRADRAGRDGPGRRPSNPWRWRCCTLTRTPSTSACWGTCLRRACRACTCRSPRAGGHFPRVRASRDHRG